MTHDTDIPQGYKATALGIIPQEWEVMRLGDIVSITSGESPSLYHLKSEGKYPYVKVEDLNNCEKYQESSREYSDDNNTTIKAGSIIFPKRGASILNNKVRIAAKDIQMDSNMMAITPHTAIVDTEFLYIRILYERLYRIADTSSIPQINNKHIIPYKIAVPPLAEQRKIAEVLGVWDEAIEKQARLIEKLALRKRGLMQRLLSAKLRFPGFSEPWQKVKLGKIGKFDKGYGVPKESIRNTGNKAITYGEIYTKHYFVIKKFTSYIDDETAAASKKITQGAILFTGSGETLEDIGKCVAFIDNDIAYAGGDIIIFNPSIEIEINSLVLSYCLNSAPVNAQKATYGQGHSVVHIYQKDLAKLQVTIPSFSEQNAIAEVLTAADREIELAKEKLERLRRQKRGLMQQLLSGKKRIKY